MQHSFSFRASKIIVAIQVFLVVFIALTILVTHGMSFAGLFYCVVLAVSAYALFLSYRNVSRIQALRISDARLSFLRLRGDEEICQSVSIVFFSHLLVIIRVKTPGGHGRYLPILFDSLSKEDFRLLRVWIKSNCGKLS